MSRKHPFLIAYQKLVKRDSTATWQHFLYSGQPGSPAGLRTVDRIGALWHRDGAVGETTQLLASFEWCVAVSDFQSQPCQLVQVWRAKGSLGSCHARVTIALEGRPVTTVNQDRAEVVALEVRADAICTRVPTQAKPLSSSSPENMCDAAQHCAVSRCEC